MDSTELYQLWKDDETCLPASVLEAYGRGALKGQALHAVERHLVDCDFCSEAAEGLAQVQDADREVAVLQDRIAQTSRGSGFTPWQQNNGLRYAAAIALIAVVAIVATLLIRQFTSHTTDMVAEQVLRKDAVENEVITATPGENEGLKNAPGLSDETDAGPETTSAEELKSAGNNGKVIRGNMVAGERGEDDAEFSEMMKQEEILAETTVTEENERTASVPDPSPAAAPVVMEKATVDAFEAKSRSAGREERKSKRSDNKALTNPAPPMGEASSAQHDRNFPLKKQAEYPGGTTAMKQYLDSMLVYAPEDSAGLREAGTVWVTVTVLKDGSLDKIHITEGLSPMTDAKVLDAIRRMPRWQPAKLGTDTVESEVHIPVYIGPGE